MRLNTDTLASSLTDLPTKLVYPPDADEPLFAAYAVSNGDIIAKLAIVYVELGRLCAAIAVELPTKPTFGQPFPVPVADPLGFAGKHIGPRTNSYTHILVIDLETNELVDHIPDGPSLIAELDLRTGKITSPFKFALTERVNDGQSD